MRTLKEIAGDILIYLYQQQRESGFNIGGLLRFDDAISTVNLTPSSEFDIAMVKAGNDSPADLYNALMYLRDKRFIEFHLSTDSMGQMMHGFHVTSEGVDIIEGIERGEAEQARFYVTFNIKLADNINVESLIKTQLDSIFKASIL